MRRTNRWVVAAITLACASCGSTEKREADPAPNAPVAPAGAQAPGQPLLAMAGPGLPAPVMPQVGGARPRPAGGAAAGSVKEQERRALADSYFAAGQRLYREMRYHDAAQQLRLAVQNDPNHADARQLLDQTLYILGDRVAGYRDEMRRISEETKVRIEIERMEVERLYAEGQRYMERKEFPRAIDRFEKCIETIEYFPYNIDMSGLRAQAESSLELAGKKEKERDLLFKEQLQKAAKQQASIGEERNVAYHRARVRSLMERAQNAFDRTEFEKAERLSASVMSLEPTNVSAKKLNERSGHARRFKRELDTIGLRMEEMKRLMEGVYEAAIPYQTIFMFPDDDAWEAVLKRSVDLNRMFASKGKSESQEEVRIKQTLESLQITINFPGTAFDDAIDFLRDVTGINYVVARAAQEEIESSEPEITLKLKEITLKNALDLILAEAGGLIYRVRNDAVVINTADEEKEDMYLRFYEVSEIIGSPPDYEAPRLALKRPTDGDGGGGAGAILDLGDDGEEGGPGVTADKLIELIEQKLGDEDDGTVEFMGGLLMVRKPLKSHEKIALLLDQLRRTTGIMVTVETRIIDIQDNLLEEIGVDFRGLPGIIPNFLGNALDQTIGFNWTNADGDLDIRSALVNTFSNALGSAAGTPFNLASLGGGAFQYNLLDDFQLQAIADAVKREQKAKQVDSPRITVFNGQRSHVLTVSQRAYISDIEVNQTGVTPTINPVIGVLNSGSILEARPIVSFDRKFATLEIQPTVAVNGQSVFQQLQLIQGQGGANTDITIELPVVSLSEIRTTVTVPDGGTVILGGLKNFLKQENYAGIPIIRNVPFLHNLFERKGYSDLKRSLIVLLTVDITIVREQEERTFNKQGPTDLND